MDGWTVVTAGGLSIYLSAGKAKEEKEKMEDRDDVSDRTNGRAASFVPSIRPPWLSAHPKGAEQVVE